jgi:hypothetical protein
MIHDEIQAFYYHSVIKALPNTNMSRVVVIFQRSDSSFGFEEMKFDKEEQCWIPCGRYSEAFISNLETALKEARDRVSWLCESENKDVT